MGNPVPTWQQRGVARYKPDLQRLVDYEEADDLQVAHAALAGYRVIHRPQGDYPWRAVRPDGSSIGVYLTGREAWMACFSTLIGVTTVGERPNG